MLQPRGAMDTMGGAAELSDARVASAKRIEVYILGGNGTTRQCVGWKRECLGFYVKLLSGRAVKHLRTLNTNMTVLWTTHARRAQLEGIPPVKWESAVRGSPLRIITRTTAKVRCRRKHGMRKRSIEINRLMVVARGNNCNNRKINRIIAANPHLNLSLPQSYITRMR